jgi:hypothetical protein
MPRLLACFCLLIALALNLTDVGRLPAAEPAPIVTDWGDCGACHSFASAEYPRLSQLRPSRLGTLTQEDCLACHRSPELNSPRIFLGHPVRSIGDHLECAACHQAVPHGPGQPPPVPVGDYIAEGCYSCHRSVDARQHMVSRHAPLQARCIDCHPPHAPLRAALPLDILPPRIAREQGFAADPYASNADCLRCHNAASLLGGLQEGFVVLNTVNYHELHVLRGQSLCIECHEPHGGILRALMRDELLDGSSFTYRPLADGGTCSVRCHGVEHQDFRYSNRAY